ncbi:MAG: hydroxymethylbilane synthase [Polyangiaceae bacterium]|nr:hydroxymethylbilane synthase [Polyangiaceae bacterium]
MTESKLVFATRKSALALAQSRAFVARLVAAAGADAPTIEELHVTTSGDRFVEQRLQDIGGKGLFIKELEEALLDRRADFAVHSIKDVPAELVPGLHIACIPLREDPRDVLITRGNVPLDELPNGARLGTSSLRRALFMKRLRPDLQIETLRGNVDTRMRKVEEGQYDAIVLAYAGLKRLGIESRATRVLSPEESLPAVGQGALGVECRQNDAAVEGLLSKVHHAETAVCVAAERAVMARVGGNCRMPIAAHAVREATALVLRALVADADGSNPREGMRRVDYPVGERAEEEARRVGEDLGGELAKG